MKKRTYVDSGVLIAAFRGDERIAKEALTILEDQQREIVISDYVRLEVLPKPKYLGHTGEVDFMQEIFAKAQNVQASPDVTEKALDFACRYDIAAMDALHVGSAAAAGVDELVTLERPTKPICKVKEVRVASLAN